MQSLGFDFPFPLSSQLVANALHGGSHHVVKQVMSLHIEICGIRGDTEGEQTVLCLQIFLFPSRELALQFLNLDKSLVAYLVNRLAHLAHAHVLDGCDNVEVGDGEMVVFALAV